MLPISISNSFLYVSFFGITFLYNLLQQLQQLDLKRPFQVYLHLQSFLAKMFPILAHNYAPLFALATLGNHHIEKASYLCRVTQSGQGK
jgi:hypothetical protein